MGSGGGAGSPGRSEALISVYTVSGGQAFQRIVYETKQGNREGLCPTPSQLNEGDICPSELGHVGKGRACRLPCVSLPQKGRRGAGPWTAAVLPGRGAHTRFATATPGFLCTGG